MLKEIEPQQFSDEEKEEIGALAKDLAQGGQAAIDNLMAMKMSLCGISLKAIDLPSQIGDRVDLARCLLHEVGVIDEVLRQAMAIRQLQGIDDLSELDRCAQAKGLGSIFDESSPIGAKLKGYLG